MTTFNFSPKNPDKKNSQNRFKLNIKEAVNNVIDNDCIEISSKDSVLERYMNRNAKFNQSK